MRDDDGSGEEGLASWVCAFLVCTKRMQLVMNFIASSERSDWTSWRAIWAALGLVSRPSLCKCSDLRGSEQPAAFQEGIETSSPPGAKEGCQGHLAVGALP